MVTIEEFSQIPIVQIVLVVIIVYLFILGVRTFRAWLRVWEINAIAKEKEILDKGGKELKAEVTKRLGNGKSKVTKQIEESLGIKK